MKNRNSIKNYLIYFLLIIVSISSIVTPGYSEAVLAAPQDSLTSIQPPSKKVSDAAIQPEQWTTVAEDVYNDVQTDVYGLEDSELEKALAKLASLNKNQFRSFVMFSTEENSTNIESSLTEKQVELLILDGAEVADVYWLEYLVQKTGVDPLEMWKYHETNRVGWEKVESAYAASTRLSVTEEVYSVERVSKLNKSAKNSVSIASTSDETLEDKISTAFDTLIRQQMLSSKTNDQYSDTAGSQEEITPGVGNLTWQDQQIHLPGRDGLDLDIGVAYNSSDASAYYKTHSSRGAAIAAKGNYMASRYDLGLGWQFQFPSVEDAQPENAYRTYHDGHGGAKGIDFYTNIMGDYISPQTALTYETHLDKPQGKELRFVSDEKGLFTNGQETSRSYMEYLNQKREYFSPKGNLLGIVDRFGNQIIFNYETRIDYTGETKDVISSITDTIGRKVVFQYDSSLQQESFAGEDVRLIVYDQAGKEIQRVTYTKSRVALTKQGASDGYAPVLAKIINSAGESKVLDYNIQDGAFRYYTSKGFANQPFALLKKITYPRSITQYSYESATHGFGKKGELIDYRVVSREDQLQKSDGTIQNGFNKLNYTYSGDYSNYLGNKEEKLKYRYSQTLMNSDNRLTRYIFNGENQLLATEVSDSKQKVITENQQFHPVFELKPTLTKIVESDDQGSSTYYTETSYNDWGGIQSQTDKLTQDDYNNQHIKDQHTVTYSYTDVYKLLASKTWYQNNNKQISEQYSYNTSGRLQSTTNAAGEVTNYSYEPSPSGSNQIQKVTETRKVRDGMSTSVTTTFGADYNYAYPTEQTQTLTNAGKNTQTVRQTMKYDSGTGLLTEQTDSDGRKTTTTYDALGRPTRIVSPSITNLDGTVYAVEDQYAYTNRAYSTEADNVNSGILTMRVDSIRQYTNTATGATTILTRQSSYYDGMGFLRVDETYNGTNGWTRSQYHPDDQGRAVYAIDPAGNTQTAAYDAWGQQIEFTDAQGNMFVNKAELTQHKAKRFAVAADQVSAYRSNPGNAAIQLNYVEQSYDAYGHMTGMLAYQDGSARSQPIRESYSYDLVGNILTYTDPNNNRNASGVTTAFTYDGLNRLTSVQDAMDQTSRYGYDGLGSLSKVTISDTTGKNETLYSKDYNELGQMTKKTDPSGNSTDLTYNQRGLNDQQTDRNGTVTNYQYDERGQRTVATLKGTDGSTLQTKSIFGSDGNLLTDRHELYLNGTKTATQTSTIDKLDRVTSLVSTANGYNAQLNVTYDSLDRMTSQKNSLNGNSLFTNYGYDKSRLTQIQTNGGQTRTTAKTANIQYDYTPLGQVRSITFPTLSDGTTLRESMSYDPLNRLSRLTNAKGDQLLSVYNYQYDANGNITGIKEQVQSGAAQTSTYAYDKLNRLTVVKRADGSETQYTYDLRGNRKTMSDTQELPETEPASYTYDLDDRLTSVTGSKGKTVIQYLSDGLRYLTVHGTVTTHYGYDLKDQVVAEKTGDSAFAYIRGDRTLVKKDQNNKKDYYYLYNGHGDVVQIIGADGNLVNSYQYDEWGNILKQKESISNSFKYAGESYDGETGLYYLKARYYDPTTGRFLNEDTYEGQITNPLSMNGYTYTHNNPLRYVDPSGHHAIEASQETMDGWPTAPSSSKSNTGGGAGGKGKSTTASKESGQKKSNQPKPAPKPDSATNADALAAEQRDQVKQAVKNNKSCNCFIAGTKVQTDEGEKNIEDIKVGDKVLSKNEATGEVAYKEVTVTFNHETDRIYSIHVGGQTIESTFNHPFWVEGKGWTYVKDLEVGDLLVQSDGNTLRIDSVKLLHKHTNVYNMTVDRFHTYFVSDLGIWVHNTGPCPEFTSINYDKKQFGQKYGEHRDDYPGLSHQEYKALAEDIYKNPDKVVHDTHNGEYYYIKGNDLLRVKENGDFVSLYPGADSPRVQKAIE